MNQCTHCSMPVNEWTNAQLSFKIDPCALTLVLHGPLPLHIRCFLTTDEKLVAWNTKLVQQARVSDRLDVQVRTTACACDFPATEEITDKETYVPDAQAVFWFGRLVLACESGGNTLKITHKYATTRIFVPGTSLPWKQLLFFSSQIISTNVGVQLGESSSSKLLEGQCLHVKADNTIIARLSSEAKTIIDRHCSPFRDAEGIKLVELWHKNALVFLQHQRYWLKGSVQLSTNGDTLQLNLTRTSGVTECITIPASEKTRFLVEEIVTDAVYDVQVKYVPTEQSFQGTQAAVADGVLWLTYDTTTELIQLPSDLATALAGLRTACTRRSSLRVWWWNRKNAEDLPSTLFRVLRILLTILQWMWNILGLYLLVRLILE